MEPNKAKSKRRKPWSRGRKTPKPSKSTVPAKPQKGTRKKASASVKTTKRKAPRRSKTSLLRRVKAALKRAKSRPQFIKTNRPRSSSKATPPRTPTKIDRWKRGPRKRAHASMQFFSDAKSLRADVTRKTASTIGSYLSAVRILLERNYPDALAAFAGKTVKDVRNKTYPLETRPNVLYRLNSSVEPFEEVYRLIS